MDGAEVGVLKQPNQVGLRGLLQSKNALRLEAKIRLEVLGNLANQTLKRKFAEQELSRLLITTNLTKRNSAWPVTMGLFYTTILRPRPGLAGGLGRQSLARSLATSGLASSLFSTSHMKQSIHTYVYIRLYKINHINHKQMMCRGAQAQP